MFETPEQFRDRIRGHLKGSFAKKAEETGIKTLSEVDPQGQPQPGQTSGGQANQSGQKNQQQSIQAPPQQANFKKTIQTAFENLSAAFKSRGQLQTGTKLKNSGSVAQKAINDMYVAVNNQKLDMKTLSNTFKKNIGTVLDAIVKDVESLSKSNQQQGQQNTGSAQQPQQMNAEAVPGENLQLADENYGDGVVNKVSQSPVVEKNDPISVDSMQGILKFATPDQIGDAIKKMTPEDFQQFTNGLQKTALDVIAKSVNGAGAAPAAPSNKNNNPNNDGGVNQEGNLKLGAL